MINGKIQTRMLGRAEEILSCACKMEVKGGGGRHELLK